MSLVAGCDCGAYRGHEAGGVDAGDDPPADCDADPTAPGCPCDSVEPEVCYDGPPETMGIGACRAGTRACVDGAWRPCVGQTIPIDEECNEIDDDCDGVVDDGVLSACGDCSEDCVESRWGDGDGEEPFAPDEANSDGVVVREDGALVLEGDRFDLDAIWVPNTAEGTISKISTSERVELARYRTGPLGAADSPSRTSLDYVGSAYVANRAFGVQASVTKLLDHGCPDVDGDGLVETSSDADDVLDWEDDECVAWNTPVGAAANALARAVAVQVRVEGGEPTPYAWVGLFNEYLVVELDAETGEPTGVEVDLTFCPPYGAAIDRDGTLWVSCGFQSRIARVDTASPDDHEMVETTGFLAMSAYGITVDGEGRVWVAGYGTDSGVYDPAAEEWMSIGESGHGVAVSEDSAWFGGCGAGTCRIDLDSLEVTSLPVNSNRGVAVDLTGMVWTIPLDGRLSVIDPDSNEFEPVLQDCGGPCLNQPYAYSDMTGFQLRNATTTEGFWQTVVEGCAEGETRWVRLDWEVEIADDTAVRFQTRAADDLAALDLAEWVDVAVAPDDAPPVSIEKAGDGRRFLGVRVVLETGAHGLTPVIHSVAVQRTCPGFS